MYEYEHPTHAGALNISANTSHITDLTIRYDHKEDIFIIKNTVDVQKSLKKYIFSSIDKLYIN